MQFNNEDFWTQIFETEGVKFMVYCLWFMVLSPGEPVAVPDIAVLTNGSRRTRGTTGRTERFPNFKNSLCPPWYPVFSVIQNSSHKTLSDIVCVFELKNLKP